MSKDRLLLRYNNIPVNYLLDLSNASEEKLEILKTKMEVVLKLDTPHQMYIEGTAQPVFGIIYDKFGIKDIWGVDFAEYFKVTLDNLKSEYNILPKRFVFIYNVGVERAVNTAFSARLLKAMIKDLHNKGCWVIVESDLSYGKFSTQYDIEFVNKISIPLKKPQSFL